MYVIGVNRCASGVVGPVWLSFTRGREVKNLIYSRTPLGRAIKEGENPVGENKTQSNRYLSKAGHVKPGLNLGGPPPKAKY